ncbi:MAG: hypothetical protein IID48_02300 [Proteobacteria bacterium]|nr:hypothetical protein [Pseudomonadota bacterium]
MIVDGKVVLCDKLDTIKENHHRITLRFPQSQPLPADFDGILQAEKEGLDVIFRDFCIGK